jgi:hypothetical protein
MLFMVIEHFKKRDAKTVYRRFRDEGRLMPEGLATVDSWVETDFERCFQLVACEDPELLQVWAQAWEDLITFEFHPVMPSKEAFEILKPQL